MSLQEELLAGVAPRLAGVAERSERVRIVASYLHFERGVYPSNALVRQLVGIGSMTSIAADLRAFWEETRKRGLTTLALPGVPDELHAVASGLFGEAFAKLWARAVEVANEGLAEERAEMQAELAAARVAKERAELERAAADERADQISSALELQRQQREDAERQLVSLRTEHLGTLAALAASQEALEKEQRARVRAEEQFSSDLAAANAARTRDQELFDGEIRFAKLQIDQARQGERALRERLQQVESDAELQLTTLRRQNGALRDEIAGARAANAELERSIGALRKQTTERPRRMRAAKGPGLGRR